MGQLRNNSKLVFNKSLKMIMISNKPKKNSWNKLIKHAKDKFLIINVNYQILWISKKLSRYLPRLWNQAHFTFWKLWWKLKKKEFREILCKAHKSNNLWILCYWRKKNHKFWFKMVLINLIATQAKFSLVLCRLIWNKIKNLTIFSRSLNNTINKSWLKFSRVSKWAKIN